MSGRIVVGIDGSAASAEALRWALRQSRATGTPVEVICAWHYAGIHVGLVPTFGVDMEATAQEILRDTVENLADPDHVVVCRTVSGHPVRVLVEASESADLLVVGNRGHGGFEGMRLGSVSSQVTSYAHCPTVVVPVSS